MRSLILPALCIFTGCASSSPEPRDTGAGALPKIRVAVKQALPRGTLLALQPCEVVRPGKVGRELIDGLMREALRQNTHFDIGAGVEGCDSQFRLVIAIDPQAQVLTASLVVEGRAPLPLCAANYAERGIPAAIDELSSGSLQALGAGKDRSLQPCRTIYSPNPICVRLTEQGIVKLNRGNTEAALRLLRQARAQDPGCTITQVALGSTLLITGQKEAAAKLARGALEHMQGRMAPTTMHRMARLALLVQVAMNANMAAQNDARLLELAEASLRERPHDPHGLYSKALALNYLRRFEESVPMFRDLHQRWPKIAQVAYHLSFAEIATGHAEAALNSIESAARFLPDDSIVLPKSLALYHAGRFVELERYLQRLAQRSVKNGDRKRHEILRIQASLAILTGKREAAAQILLTDMEWLRRRPSLLQSLALDFAENGEVLIQLGFHQDLAPRLQAFDELRIHAPHLRQAQAYIAALISIEEFGTLPQSAIESLEGQNQHVWSSLLKASLHRRNGELAEEARYLATAVRITDSALTRASFARALEALGKKEDAQALRDDLRKRLLAMDLRKPLSHPLLNPARALAFLAVNL